MTDAWTLYHELTDAGMTVKADGGELVIRPSRLLSDELRERAVAAKPDLMALLQSDRLAYATHTGDPRPAYTPADDPLPAPESVDEAALDLLILSYAAGRRAKALDQLGACPLEIAEQVQANLGPVQQAIGNSAGPPGNAP